jgi:hypothetical protein
MTIPRSVKWVFVLPFFLLVGIPTLLVLIVFLLFHATIPIHDFVLWRMDNTFAGSVMHPVDSEVIERVSFFGTRYTDIEECTYALGELRSTYLSPSEVQKAYKDSSIKPFRFIYNVPVSVAIVDKETSLPLDNPADRWLHDFLERYGSSTTETTRYLVYIFESSGQWLGDWRCYA